MKIGLGCWSNFRAVKQVSMEEFQVMKTERDQALMELKSVRQIIVSEEEKHRVSMFGHFAAIQWSRLKIIEYGERERERERERLKDKGSV